MFNKNILQFKAGLRNVSTSLTSNAVATQIKVDTNQSKKSEYIFSRQDKYGAHNYHPLPVAIWFDIDFIFIIKAK